MPPKDDTKQANKAQIHGLLQFMAQRLDHIEEPVAQLIYIAALMCPTDEPEGIRLQLLAVVTRIDDAIKSLPASYESVKSELSACTVAINRAARAI